MLSHINELERSDLIVCVPVAGYSIMEKTTLGPHNLRGKRCIWGIPHLYRELRDTIILYTIQVIDLILPSTYTICAKNRG